jgi:hypothetical protein
MRNVFGTTVRHEKSHEGRHVRQQAEEADIRLVLQLDREQEHRVDARDQEHGRRRVAAAVQDRAEHHDRDEAGIEGKTRHRELGRARDDVPECEKRRQEE